jgi:hypothetical protein
MPILEELLLLVAAGAVGYIVYKLLRKKKPARGTKLMLVAVRRREVGVKRSLELSAEEHGATMDELEKIWRIVHDRWIGAGAIYISGFMSDAQGLPAPGDQDWRLFFLYELEDYKMFQKCIDISESEGYKLLRHHLDIRILPGDTMPHIGNKLRRVM